MLVCMHVRARARANHCLELFPFFVHYSTEKHLLTEEYLSVYAFKAARRGFYIWQLSLCYINMKIDVYI